MQLLLVLIAIAQESTILVTYGAQIVIIVPEYGYVNFMRAIACSHRHGAMKVHHCIHGVNAVSHQDGLQLVVLCHFLGALPGLGG